MTGPRVVVLGDAALDVHVTAAAGIRRAADVPARVEVASGGQGANVAVRVARRGVPVALVAAMGPDAAGSLLREALREDGVDLRTVGVDRTGTVVVLREADGERTMLSDRAAFAERVDLATLPESAWLVVSGYLLHEPAAADLAAALGRGSWRRMLLGCAVPRERLDAWRAAAALLRPDLLVVNRQEATDLVRRDAAGTAITDAGGATLRIAGVTVSSLTGTAAPAVDTTGAGDAFAAALVAGLLDEAWPPSREVMQDAVEAAVALASRVARVAGAQARVAGERTATLRG